VTVAPIRMMDVVKVENAPTRLGQEATWAVQVVLICIGHVAGVVASHRIARRLFPERRQAIRSLLPQLVMMVGLSVCGLWLMHLDMNMRMGRM
jgi:uncharacterized membrane protein